MSTTEGNMKASAPVKSEPADNSIYPPLTRTDKRVPDTASSAISKKKSSSELFRPNWTDRFKSRLDIWDDHFEPRNKAKAPSPEEVMQRENTSDLMTQQEQYPLRDLSPKRRRVDLMTQQDLPETQPVDW